MRDHTRRRCVSSQRKREFTGFAAALRTKDLELLGIAGYISAIQFSNSPEKYGFFYLPQEDAFSCPEGAKLVYNV